MAYTVMGLPPLLLGADQDKVTWPLPAVAEFKVGAPGTVAGTAGTSSDHSPSPWMFNAHIL